MKSVSNRLLDTFCAMPSALYIRLISEDNHFSIRQGYCSDNDTIFIQAFDDCLECYPFELMRSNVDGRTRAQVIDLMTRLSKQTDRDIIKLLVAFKEYQNTCLRLRDDTWLMGYRMMNDAPSFEPATFTLRGLML